MVRSRIKVPQFGLIFGLCLLISFPALASDKTIQFSADSVRSVFEKGSEKTELNGNATVNTGSLRIKANKIQIIGAKQRFVRANGAVSIRDEERNLMIQGATLNYDRDLEIVKLEGNAILEDFKNDMTIRAAFFEYRLNDNIAILNVGVRIYKKDLNARAEYAMYQRDAKMVELNGLPVVTRKGDTYKANVIKVNTETDEIQLLGTVSGSVDSGTATASPSGTKPSASPQPGQSARSRQGQDGAPGEPPSSTRIPPPSATKGPFDGQ